MFCMLKLYHLKQNHFQLENHKPYFMNRIQNLFGNRNLATTFAFLLIFVNSKTIIFVMEKMQAIARLELTPIAYSKSFYSAINGIIN